MRWILIVVIGSLAWPAPHAEAVPCSPANYTKITNTGPMPSDFCAFAYLPFRVKIPASPANIDTANTSILQTQYLPNSGLGNGTIAANNGINQMYTIGVDTRGKAPNVGNGAHPAYIASATDPLVHIDCTGAPYGCGNMNGESIGPHDIPDMHIPAYARPTYRYEAQGDIFMTVIQPDGGYFEQYGCHKGDVDWVNGETLSRASCGLAGASYGNIVTSAGNNVGNINAGDGQIALPVYWNEVQNNQINHAIHVFAGCFRGGLGRYPGTYAGECFASGGPSTGIPVGSHIWLDLTRAQIDATPTSIIPAHMRVFAYALHEHGAFVLDTGDGHKWITQFTLEDALPCFTSGACTKSFWQDWFYANGGGGPTADGNLKINTPIDWSALATHVHVLQECYARGTCSDSIPETVIEPPPPGPGKIAAWPLDEGSGTSAADATGNGHTASWIPGPTWVPGQVGPFGLHCDGAHAANVTSGPLPASGAYSYMFWLSADTPPETRPQQLVVRNGVTSDSYGFSWGHPTPGFQHAAYQQTAGNQYVVAQLPLPLSAMQRYHIAVTWDGSQLVAYRDGVAVATTPAPSLLPATGGFTFCGAQATNTFYPGVLDELQVWNYALTAPQVQAEYAKGATPRAPGARCGRRGSRDARACVREGSQRRRR
jgi:hypothetical protein